MSKRNINNLYGKHGRLQESDYSLEVARWVGERRKARERAMLMALLRRVREPAIVWAVVALAALALNIL